MKKYRKEIISVLFFLGVMSIAFYFNYSEKNRSFKKKRVIGYLDSRGLKYEKWTYNVNDVDYSLKVSKSQGGMYIEKEEMYYIYYDKLTPGNSFIDYSMPYVDSTEFKYSYTLPTNLTLTRGINYITYDYSVNGIKLSRTLQYKALKDTVFKSAEIKIIYNILNPKISYLCL